MRDGNELDIERPNIEAAAERQHLYRYVGCKRLGQALCFKQRRGKRRRINWTAQLRPQIHQCAEVIFMRMREHEPRKVAPVLDQERDVRHDQVDAGQVVARERHAEINRHPGALSTIAEAVERKIHPDLADSAERREEEFGGHQTCTGAGKISPAVIGSSWPAGSRNIRRPVSSSDSNLPVSSRLASRTTMSPPIPAACDSHSERMVAKPAPRPHCASRTIIAPESAAKSCAGSTATPARARSVARCVVSH